MSHLKVWIGLSLLMLAGCGPREQINITRNVQEQPAPDIQATVLPLEHAAVPAADDAAKPKAE